jgi:hypothetical protein
MQVWSLVFQRLLFFLRLLPRSLSLIWCTTSSSSQGYYPEGNTCEYDFINTTPQLTQVSGEGSLDSFRPDDFVDIGVPIGTDTFVKQFVTKTCRDIIEDVQKLDSEDDFIRFQLLRFCQATSLQYLNSHIILDNRCVLQEQHVDCKIVDVLLKKGTKFHADGWDTSNKDWAHMVLQLPHAEGGFSVPFNCVTKDAVFYYTSSVRPLH